MGGPSLAQNARQLSASRQRCAVGVALRGRPVVPRGSSTFYKENQLFCAFVCFDLSCVSHRKATRVTAPPPRKCCSSCVAQRHHAGEGGKERLNRACCGCPPHIVSRGAVLLLTPAFYAHFTHFPQAPIMGGKSSKSSAKEEEVHKHTPGAAAHLISTPLHESSKRMPCTIPATPPRARQAPALPAELDAKLTLMFEKMDVDKVSTNQHLCHTGCTRVFLHHTV